MYNLGEVNFRKLSMRRQFIYINLLSDSVVELHVKPDSSQFTQMMDILHALRLLPVDGHLP